MVLLIMLLDTSLGDVTLEVESLAAEEEVVMVVMVDWACVVNPIAHRKNSRINVLNSAFSTTQLCMYKPFFRMRRQKYQIFLVEIAL